MGPIILSRGGGDIASGIALRLFRSGFRVIMTDREYPLAVRRTVSFSEAFYSGFTNVENFVAWKVRSFESISDSLQNYEIPILVDEKLEILKISKYKFPILINARMEKRPPGINLINSIPLVIGIGPGFTVGFDCHVGIESNRGHFLGCIYRNGTAFPDTGQPGGDPIRILFAPNNGIFITYPQIGDLLESGHLIATFDDQPIFGLFTGLLRRLILSNLNIKKGMKVGDMDHRTNIDLCQFASDKAMAFGRSVLEVILSDTNILPIHRVIS